jgi:transketolase
VPDDVCGGLGRARAGAARAPTGGALRAPTAAAHPALAAEFERRMAGALPADWTAGRERLALAPRAARAVATRKASQKALARWRRACPSCWAAAPTSPAPT